MFGAHVIEKAVCGNNSAGIAEESKPHLRGPKRPSEYEDNV
jgi:hypothetical protein